MLLLLLLPQLQLLFLSAPRWKVNASQYDHWQERLSEQRSDREG
jgi:hypothetical protein